MTNNKVPLILLTGFLGSGKTTLLKRIVQTYGRKLKVGVIQNEFAPASIDGAVLRAGEEPFELLEINNGSVFCVCLLDHFVGSASAFLREHNPDLLLMEASGLSDPVGIAEILQDGPLAGDCYLHKIVCIIDALNFLKSIRMSRALQRQVMIADHVLVNKADLANEDHRDRVERLVRKINPHASMDLVSYCVLDPDRIVESLDQLPAIYSLRETGKLPDPLARPDVRVGVVKSSRMISIRNLQTFIRECAPGTYRMKGFVKLDDGVHVSIQTSFDQVSIDAIPGYKGPTELIAIGEHLDFRKLARRYRELATYYGVERV